MRKPVARLHPGGRRRLRKPETHLAAIEAWADGFRDAWPRCSDSRVHVHWHLPADQRLVDPPWAARAHQVRAVEALLAAAANLRATRPEACVHQIVYVVLHWPALFMAEVGVFLDPAYAAGFETRDDAGQVWRKLPAERSLAAELDIEIPSGFGEYGYREILTDEDRVHESEIWVIREPLPAVAG